MYDNAGLEQTPFIFMYGFYKWIFGVSVLVVTLLFIWGLFSKKHDFVRKIVGVEILLFFLLVQLLIAKDCFKELGFLLDAGIDARFLIQYLRSYFFMAFALSAVSLYKLLLFLLLIVKEYVYIQE